MNIVQHQLGNHPLIISMLPDASVAISPTEPLNGKTLFDFVGEDLEVVVNKDGILTKKGNNATMQYLFNTRYYYKEEPNLLEWLKSFHMGEQQYGG